MLNSTYGESLKTSSSSSNIVVKKSFSVVTYRLLIEALCKAKDLDIDVLLMIREEVMCNIVFLTSSFCCAIKKFCKIYNCMYY